MLNPAVPTLATINDPTLTEVTIAFDKALTPNAALDIANWKVRWVNNTYTVSAAAADAVAVTLTVAVGTPEEGDNIVSFTPPPFDLISGNGRPVLAFLDFPLTAAEIPPKPKRARRPSTPKAKRASP